MKFAVAFLALPLAASAWRVTTGYWAGSEADYCTSANLSKGQIGEAGSTALETDIKSFQVMEFEPDTKRADLK